MFLRQVIGRQTFKLVINVNRSINKVTIGQPLARLFSTGTEKGTGKNDQETKAASLDVEGSDSDFRPKEKATVASSDKEMLD